MVTTKGSFAQGAIGRSELSFEEAFYEIVDEVAMDGLSPGYTYVFEYCSPHNQVVRYYNEPQLSLLTAIRRTDGAELSSLELDVLAGELRAGRPKSFDFVSRDEVLQYLECQPEDTFEGFVCRDTKGRRVKVKSERYKELHRLFNNGHLFEEKHLVPLVLRGCGATVARIWPEATEAVLWVSAAMGAARSRLEAVWDMAKERSSQKEFAIFVNKYEPGLSAILFEARKCGVEPAELFNRSSDLLVKKLWPKATEE